MPSIKDHESKKKKKPTHGHHDQTKKHTNDRIQADEADTETELAADAVEAKPKSEKRRPSQLDADAIETNGQPSGSADEYETSAKSDGAPLADDVDPESFQSFSEGEKFQLNFPGSFILKAKAPKAFEFVERVAGDWIQDGNFESLPVGHPLAQILAAKALTKAKSIEKNVLSSTPVTLAKIGLEYAKSKIKR